MKCPGQDTRYWKPGAIFEVECPNCGHRAEFFKDESTRRCKICGAKLVNPRMDFGCAAYCKFAEQCLGELPPELLAQRDDLLKDRIAIEIKRHFKGDSKRIDHATRVAGYAEKIAAEEKGNPAVVLSAAYLCKMGVKEGESEQGAADPQRQYREALQLAREILARVGAREDLIEEVCTILGHQGGVRIEDTVNAKVVHDADLIARLEEQQSETGMPAETLAECTEESFLSKTGQEMASLILLKPKRETQETPETE
jgi:hypothetical protein